MSVILRQISNNMNTLKSLIENCGFLRDGETVTVETDQTSAFSSDVNCTALKIKDANNQMLFEMDRKTGELTRGRWGAWYSATGKRANHNNATSGTGNTNSVTYAIGCPNGVIIQVDYGTSGSINPTQVVFMRNNLGKPVFIFDSGSTSDPNTPGTTQLCLTFGDVSPFNTLTLNGTVRPQSEVVPMLTCADVDTLSYTVKGGWLVYHQDRTNYLRQAIINGKTYITNGWYAIETV